MESPVRDSFGKTIRKLRLDKEHPLRVVAAFLNIDQAILSKIECGQRRATRNQVLKFASFFKIAKEDLLISWLSDNILYEIENEQIALQALHVAEEKLVYGKSKKLDFNDIRNKFNFFSKNL